MFFAFMLVVSNNLGYKNKYYAIRYGYSLLNDDVSVDECNSSILLIGGRRKIMKNRVTSVCVEH